MKTLKIQQIDGYVHVELEGGQCITSTNTWQEIIKDERRKKLQELNFTRKIKLNKLSKSE